MWQLFVANKAMDMSNIGKKIARFRRESLYVTVVEQYGNSEFSALWPVGNFHSRHLEIHVKKIHGRILSKTSVVQQRYHRTVHVPFQSQYMTFMYCTGVLYYIIYPINAIFYAFKGTEG